MALEDQFDYLSFLSRSDSEILSFEKRNYPFAVAIRNQNVDAVEKCLIRGYSPNHITFDRMTAVRPLMWANTDVARVLLKYGADPNLFDGNRQLRLNAACVMTERPDHELIELLIRNGADPNKKDTCGVPLCTVDVPTVVLLERHGADIWNTYVPPNSATHHVRAQRRVETLESRLPDAIMRRVFDFLLDDPMRDAAETIWYFATGGMAAQFNAAPRVRIRAE